MMVLADWINDASVNAAFQSRQSAQRSKVIAASARKLPDMHFDFASIPYCFSLQT
jgi:hypothetical protein